MNLKKIMLAVITPVVFSNTICFTSAEPKKAAPTSSADWRPNPAYAKQLATPVKVGAYSVSPPVGFTLEHKQRQNATVTEERYTWKGYTRADGTEPKFIISLFQLMPGVTKNQTAEESLSSDLNAMRSGEKPYVHTSIQSGRVSSLSFVRAYWKRDPNDTAEGKKYHGFSYQHMQGPMTVVVIGEDTEPYQKDTLDLMEDAALTLHKN